MMCASSIPDFSTRIIVNIFFSPHLSVFKWYEREVIRSADKDVDEYGFELDVPGIVEMIFSGRIRFIPFSDRGCGLSVSLGT
jgi:hypothetical protein